jgi:hypothetical protein
MQRRKRWFVYAVLGLIVVPAAGFAAWIWIALSYGYSSGERAGRLQKIPAKRKGRSRPPTVNELPQTPSAAESVLRGFFKKRKGRSRPPTVNELPQTPSAAESVLRGFFKASWSTETRRLHPHNDPR